MIAHDDLPSDSIIVRHACEACSIMFNPDGSTSPFVSMTEVNATLEVWKAEAKVVAEEAEATVREAASILKGERESNDRED